MREPAFWWRKPGVACALLAPAAACYGLVARNRMTRRPARAGVPVVCVGNFTLGGSGKTPAVIAIAKLLRASGERVFCLSRGYGGSVSGPHRVDPHGDAASKIGDEALLLARVAPTIVSRDRAAGAEAARAAGASVIIMDDGLQNRSLEKDLTIAVVDGRRGIGNGRVFPAGPLRAPLEAQWALSDALLVVGAADGAAELIAAAKAQGQAGAACADRSRPRGGDGARRQTSALPSPASAIPRNSSPRLPPPESRRRDVLPLPIITASAPRKRRRW